MHRFRDGIAFADRLESVDFFVLLEILGQNVQHRSTTNCAHDLIFRQVADLSM